MHRHGNVILAAAVAGGVLVGPALGTPAFGEDQRPDGSVLAWVDGEAVTTIDLDIILANMQSPGADAAMREGLAPESVLRRLIQNRLLEQEGYRIGAHEKSEVRNQVLDFVQYRSMVALLDSIQAEVPKLEPGDMDSVLDRTHTMRRMSHILVDSQDFARTLLDSLEAGIPFPDLADRHSLDSTWASAGGDLGWAGEGRLIPEFEAVLPGMAKGDVAGPVATRNGWHLLYLADTHTETAGQSDPMKDAIQDARMQERVMDVMTAFLSSLKEKHGVIVNEPFLASLDYASSDPSIQAELRTSEAVLAQLPGRTLTVKGLSFKIRFKYFHGTEGKENADQIRDEVFNDWLAELLFRYEAKEQGYTQRPALVAAADKLERRLIREIVLESIADFAYEPDPEEIKTYYAENQDAFTRSTRIKVDGVLISEVDAAHGFREKLEQGATMSWLADRSPEVLDANPKIFSDWLDPEILGISGGSIAKGTIVGPILLEEKWAVTKVIQVGSPQPIPLEKCRSLVIKTMRSNKRHEAVSRSVALLESRTKIEVENTAYGNIEKRVGAWLSGQS